MAAARVATHSGASASKPDGLKKIVIICGLTASGKSGVGVELAKMFNGEIVSADSRQIYKGIDIGSGKVTSAEMGDVPHHMLDVARVGERFDVFNYKEMAEASIDNILKRGKLPIIVGGTGLYTRAIKQGYGFEGINQPKYDVLQICLLPPKEILKAKIMQRTTERLRAGLVDETRAFLDAGISEQFMASLGFEYKLTIELINGKISEQEFYDWFIIRSMQYAKRQRTWFKKESNTTFLEDSSTYIEQCTRLIEQFIN